MAQCPYCRREMKMGVSCKVDTVVFEDGEKYTRLTDHFSEPDGYCHDCNAPHGGYHHPGCDVERCPRCGGQQITCDC